MPRQTDPPAPRPLVDPAAHLDWAAGIARRVAYKKNLRNQELDDLVSEAHAKVCELAARPADDNGFDPLLAVDADLSVSFRVFAYLTVWKACDREAMRIRGGGLFRTARPESLKKVGIVAVLGDSAELVAIDPPELHAERDAEPIPELARPGGPYRGLGRRLVGVPRADHSYLVESQVERFVDLAEDAA